MKNMQDYASVYVDEYELSVTPVKGKIPIVKDWQKVCGDSIFAERYEDAWLQATGLGLLCGEASGLICLDIDILETDDHLSPVLNELLSKLPPLLLGRIGNSLKPPARFFKYNGDQSRKFKWLKIEILSDGNQVLLPPSLHPDTGDKYKWADLRLSQVDLDDLPVLDETVVSWLEEMNEKFKPEKKSREASLGGSRDEHKGQLSSSPGRCKHQSHNFISSFAIAKYYAGISKEELVSAVLAYDKKVNGDADSLYFTCPSRKWRSSDAKTNASRFIDEIFTRHPAEHGKDKKRVGSGDSSGESSSGDKPNYFWEDDNGKRHRSDKKDDFLEFFEWLYPSARKDYFTRTVFYNENKDKAVHEWIPVENELRFIRAEARDCGLMPTLVEDNLYRWMKGLKRRLLIDIPKWDGQDHIGNLLGYITVKNVTHNQFESLFKAWMAGIFKRVYNPEFHNQCVILKGKQGIGKDMLLGNIFKALNGYYSEIIMSHNQKDNYESIERLMVSYIPEFDESSRIPISSIKAFISARKATFRGAYDRKASGHTFRHSVVSSANFDNILRDSSGNRRFWIFEIDEINWKYNEIMNSEQMLAQAFALFKDNYVATPGSLEAMREYIVEQTPKATDELFLEEAHHLIEQRIENMVNRFDAANGHRIEDPKIRWHMISEDIVRIAKRYNLAPKTAMNILNQKGYRQRDKKSSYYSLPSENKYH